MRKTKVNGFPSARSAAAVVSLLAALLWSAPGVALSPVELMLIAPGAPVPEFSLPPVEGRTRGLANTDLAGEVSIVSVFASWCLPCRDEHPVLVDLARQGIAAVHGLNYKDKPADARRWLDQLGDPFTRTGDDRDGEVAEAWGLYALPQTFVVDRAGRTAYVHIGPLDWEAVDKTILPLINRLRAAPD